MRVQDAAGIALKNYMADRGDILLKVQRFLWNRDQFTGLRDPPVTLFT
jgi:hypothetical protein